MKIRSLFAAVILMSAPAYSLSLSPSESNIVEAVKLDQSSQLRFLEKLVNIQSGTMNIKGVRETGNIVKKELEHLGFKATWADEPPMMHRAGTLIAIHSGSKGKRLLLIGHFDTVFAKQTPFKKYSQKGRTATGQGVIDDKGGIAVMLYALKALHKTGELKDANITVILTGDEEDSGKPTNISRQPLLMAARQCDVALDFEPSITLETATIARRGISNWTLTTHGNASHSATIFQQGVGAGAIFGIANLLEEMRRQMQDMPYLTFNPGLILGGSTVELNRDGSSGTAAGKENIVASHATAKGDIRYIDEAEKQAAKNKMTAIAASSLPGVKASIEFIDGIPPMSPTENNLKLLDEYSQVSQDLGAGKVTPLSAGIRGAGDISYVSQIVNASLSGLGPLGSGSHTVIESIDLDSLPIQTERAAILISRLIK